MHTRLVVIRGVDVTQIRSALISEAAGARLTRLDDPVSLIDTLLVEAERTGFAVLVAAAVPVRPFAVPTREGRVPVRALTQRELYRVVAVRAAVVVTASITVAGPVIVRLMKNRTTRTRTAFRYILRDQADHRIVAAESEGKLRTFGQMDLVVPTAISTTGAVVGYVSSKTTITGEVVRINARRRVGAQAIRIHRNLGLEYYRAQADQVAIAALACLRLAGLRDTGLGNYALLGLTSTGSRVLIVAR